jgi:6-phosphogluconolactonase
LKKIIFFNSNVKINIYDSINKLEVDCSKIFINQLNKGLCIVPGGNTPKKIFEIIQGNKNLLNNREILLSDDRLVDVKSHLSNYKMLNQDLNISYKNNFPISYFNYLHSSTLENLEKHISLLSENKNIVCSFLGIGSDAHTASLFPNNQDNVNQKHSCFLVKNDFDDFKRFTLSYNTLLSSQKIVFIVTGENKNLALKNIFSKRKDFDNFPAQKFLYDHPNVEIFCDSKAFININI